MQYDRVSQNPRNFQSVFVRQLSLADALRKREVEVENAKVESVTLMGAVRTLDADVRSRLLEHRVRIYEDGRTALPSERSNAKRLSHKRSTS